MMEGSVLILEPEQDKSLICGVDGDISNRLQSKNDNGCCITFGRNVGKGILA
jgi:hypothetical protein